MNGMKHRLLSCLLCLMPLCMAAQDDELRALREGLEAAERAGNRDSIATACAYLTAYYAYRDADSTLYYGRKGLEHARRDQVDPYLPLLINYATAYTASGDMREAVLHLLRAYREAVRLQAPAEYKVALLTSLGVSYRRREMPDSALYYYNEALGVLEKDGSYEDRTHLLASIAVLYANTFRLDEAEDYARRAVEASAMTDDIDMVFYAVTTAGAILQRNGKAEEAATMLRPAIRKARSQQKPMFVLKGMVYLIDCFSALGQMDSVARYMALAEEVKRQLPENATEVLGYEENRYRLLSRMGRYRESLAVQRHLLALRDVNAQTPIDRLYCDMARNYEGLEDGMHAAEYYRKAYEAADSLHQAQVNADLSEWSVKYETKEKELEIARLTQEQLRQEARALRWAVVAAVALFALLCGMLYYFLRRKRVRKEEELRLAQRYIDGMERERSRLARELHDGVCNDLLGIGMQMQCLQPGEEGKMLQMVERVREDVRHISHELMPPKFRHVTLPEAVGDYVARLSVPSSMRLSCAQEGDGGAWQRLPEQVAYEAYRIVQELLSNIVRHSGAAHVEVCLSFKEGLLELSLADDGVWKEDASALPGGIGLDTVEERVKALGGALSVAEEGGLRVRTLTVTCR